jgi:hypothetical protein
MMAQDAIRTLRQAVDGLTYPSDSDEPFDLFIWDAGGTARQTVAAHAGADRRVEEVEVQSFFAQLDDADDAPRYRALQKTMASSLDDLSVFRVGEGEVRVDIYLLGKMASGQWAGVHTVSIET